MAFIMNDFRTSVSGTWLCNLYDGFRDCSMAEIEDDDVARIYVRTPAVGEFDLQIFGRMEGVDQSTTDVLVQYLIR
jgi:hypothetical protein